MREYPAFDWLRLFLASVVFWVHAGYLQFFDASGNLAVQIFFALSGWLIGGIILQMSAYDFPRFFYNRLTRIWIPYVAATILLYTTAATKEGISVYFWKNFIYDITLTHNLFVEKSPEIIKHLPMQGTGAHFWSIAVEEQFYLMAPILIVMTPFGKNWIAWAFLTLAALFFDTWYSSVSAGVLAVMLQHKFRDWHLTFFGTTFLLFTGMLATAMLFLKFLDYRYVAPLIAITVVLILSRPGKRHSFGVFIGGISYPMYLNHWTGLFFSNALREIFPQLSNLLTTISGFFFSLIVSMMAYYLIDRNVLRNREKFYTPNLGRIAMVLAYALMGVGLTLGGIVIGPLSASVSAP